VPSSWNTRNDKSVLSTFSQFSSSGIELEDHIATSDHSNFTSNSSPSSLSSFTSTSTAVPTASLKLGTTTGTGKTAKTTWATVAGKVTMVTGCNMVF
jgi:hypothetical protein